MQKQLAPKGPDGLSDTCHAPVWILHFCTFFCSFSCKRKIFLGKTFYHENLQVQAVSLVYHIMSWCDLFYFFNFCKLWLQIVCKNEKTYITIIYRSSPFKWRIACVSIYDIWLILGLKGARLDGRLCIALISSTMRGMFIRCMTSLQRNLNRVLFHFYSSK